ncbi:helix-turn-helix domain-containing protein [Vibrio parahaemolyticus]|nr:helix-turn-helix domain-containing protein [Vibrio parahaemolyticus]
MSMELMVKAMKLKIGNSGRKLVLIKLADNANDQGECWPSYQYIADICEISKRSAVNHIQSLEEMGLLHREHRIGKNGQSSNVYHLTLDNGEVIAKSKKSEPTKSTKTSENRKKPVPKTGSTQNGSSTKNYHDPVQPLHGGGAMVALRGGEMVAPRISHSLEPVNESIQGIEKQVFDTSNLDNKILSTWKNIQNHIENEYGTWLHTPSQKDIDSIEWALSEPDVLDVWDEGVFTAFCYVVEKQLGKPDKVLNPLQRAMAATHESGIPEFRWKELLDEYEAELTEQFRNAEFGEHAND